jgi:hypothetical protein
VIKERRGRDSGHDSKERAVRLRLYIAGGAPTSVAALANLRHAIASDKELQANLEVVDVQQAPKRVLADRILVTPTLLRICSDDVAMMIGDLRDRETLLQFIRR